MIRDLHLLATAAAEACAATTDAAEKKSWGQYFTSVEVAGFMGSLVAVGAATAPIRVLDPGAGTGILGLAAAAALLARGAEAVRLTAIEAHPGARAHLHESLRLAREASAGRLDAKVIGADFLDLAPPGLDASLSSEPFDVVIANPPYFKLSPRDRRGGDAPNIYARFMEISAGLLRERGQLLFIVPRSFASGRYFERFRRAFHRRMSLHRVHVFESRRDPFKAHGVLQENIIVDYRKATRAPSSVTITSSRGARDLDRPTKVEASRRLLLPDHAPHAVLRLPTCDEDLALLARLERWRDDLGSYGLAVSTGPVVPFRATDQLVHTASAATAPLLWMQHVRAGRVTWPLGAGFRKPEHIMRSAPSKLLVTNRTYVLLRRISAKEDRRRLTAAVLHAGALPGDVLGLENHLNFIHRPGGEIDQNEATALAALLSSSLFDRYIRMVSGSTQINATELRTLPLPPRPDVIELGRQLLRRPELAQQTQLDELMRSLTGANTNPHATSPGAAPHAPSQPPRETAHAARRRVSDAHRGG
ncbi:Eco57I restriction-modification methylase domain-containing protein [Haliangium sp.]|uniref:Eco57I restriction-modification methylase domain-containing protein n=1 Tax=Haliangium sp. TaxID=2663208 RepID=UPI003D11B233